MFRDQHHGKPCAYCGRLMDRASYRLQPTRDHTIPVCRGGGRIVISCLTCNGIKGDMMPETWEAFMAAHPGWWHLSKAELRRITRAPHGIVVPRRRHVRFVRQGTPPAPPVVVPPELIWEAS